ncbi:MAG: hypothetical protein ABEN55_04655, partial [Bradymonadaceae bacterium]
MRSPSIPYLLLIVAVAAAGCGDIETTGNDTGDRSSGPPPGERPPIGDHFVQEAYGIGASWFEYDDANHTVTPRDTVYRIRRDDLDALFEVTSYYDDRGESGYFSLRVRHRRDDGWGESRALTLSRNAKESAVCVALDPLEQQACDGANTDLVFRTDLRTVPAAGFAVSNPAIYTTDHRPPDTDGGRGRDLSLDSGRRRSTGGRPPLGPPRRHSDAKPRAPAGNRRHETGAVADDRRLPNERRDRGDRAIAMCRVGDE